MGAPDRIVAGRAFDWVARWFVPAQELRNRSPAMQQRLAQLFRCPVDDGECASRDSVRARLRWLDGCAAAGPLV